MAMGCRMCSEDAPPLSPGGATNKQPELQLSVAQQLLAP
jgi:hypothetical protein